MLSRTKKKMTAVAAGLLCVAAVSLSAGTARAQSNRYAEDWATLQKVLGFAGAAYGYVNGAISAIQWLTGVGGAPTGPTLDEIRFVVAEALRAERNEELASQVESLINRLKEVQIEVAANMAHMGSNPMQSTFAQTYLASRMASLRDQSSDVYTKIARILRRESVTSRDGHALEKQAVAMVPAFMLLAPMRVAAARMVGQIDASLAAGSAATITEVLAETGQVYFRLVGTYAIGWSVCENKPDGSFRCVIKGSPIGLDQRQMFRRQLYSYHHRLSNSNLNTYPALRWSQYQGIPIVNAALRTLADVEWTHRANSGNRNIKYDERTVWKMDLYTDPNDFNRTRPQFQDVFGATIRHVWACDINQPQWLCPKIEGQGN